MTIASVSVLCYIAEDATRYFAIYVSHDVLFVDEAHSALTATTLIHIRAFQIVLLQNLRWLATKSC